MRDAKSLMSNSRASIASLKVIAYPSLSPAFFTHARHRSVIAAFASLSVLHFPVGVGDKQTIDQDHRPSVRILNARPTPQGAWPQQGGGQHGTSEGSRVLPSYKAPAAL